LVVLRSGAPEREYCSPLPFS